MKKRLLTALLGVVMAAQAQVAGGRVAGGRGPQQVPEAAPKAAIANAAPVRTCESLTRVALPNTVIDRAALDPIDGSCRITATVTHPPSGDQVKVWVGIPMKDWNGRFQGTGGGGFSGGSADRLQQPVASGYAAGATDTGHSGGSGSFALDANGRLNWQAIRDNAYLGIHEMTVTGKALTRALYGAGPKFSYFSGCSTGGRQALAEIERYPDDYNGVVAGAPAINWPKLHVTQLWGELAMLAANHYVAGCKFQAATSAAIAACDRLDGAEDGVIGDPGQCTFDPKTLVGTGVGKAAGDCGAITDADAAIMKAIWDGPRRRDGSFLWYGLPRGADFAGVSGTGGAPLTGMPFGITLDWFRFFLTQNPQWDWKTITRAAYEQFWDQAVEQFGAVLGTDNPDLSEFRARGGKAIVWHGLADPLIYPQGTIDYYKRVQQQMGGAEKTNEFVRLFLAPGLGHCSGGAAGPPPGVPLDELLQWLEPPGQAPATLHTVKRDASGNVTRGRPLCAYPLVARYQGSGSRDDGANFVCSASF